LERCLQHPLRLGLLLCLLVAAAGCGQRGERERRICEQLVEPLLPPAARFVLAPSDDAVPPAETDILVGYRVMGAPVTEEWIACGFERGANAFAPSELVRVVTSARGPISAIELFLLREFWLDRGWGRGGRAEARGTPAPTAVLPQHVVNALAPGSLYALLALAISLVYAQVGRLHLALGDIGMVASFAALAGFVALAGTAPALAGGVAVGFACLIGAAWAAASGAGPMGRLWRREVASTTMPLVAAIGLSIMLREAMRIAQIGREPWLPPLLPKPLTIDAVPGAVVVVGIGPLLALSALLLTWAALFILLHRSAFGRAARACADDPAMAALCGIDVDRVRWAIFGLAGACAGIGASLMLVLYGTVGFEGGFILTLKAMTAAVVGGIGSLSGAVLGGLLLALIETLWSASFGGLYREVAVFGLLILALVLRPSGLVMRPIMHPNDRFRPV
jgi:branched-chain amino acid transport system permease protein